MTSSNSDKAEKGIHNPESVGKKRTHKEVFPNEQADNPDSPRALKKNLAPQ